MLPLLSELLDTPCNDTIRFHPATLWILAKKLEQAWWVSHRYNPYPNTEEKAALARATLLSSVRVWCELFDFWWHSLSGYSVACCVHVGMHMHYWWCLHACNTWGMRHAMYCITTVSLPLCLNMSRYVLDKACILYVDDKCYCCLFRRNIFRACIDWCCFSYSEKKK